MLHKFIYICNQLLLLNTLLLGEYISRTTSFSLISQGFSNHVLVCWCGLYVFFMCFFLFVSFQLYIFSLLLLMYACSSVYVFFFICYFIYFVCLFSISLTYLPFFRLLACGVLAFLLL